MLCALIANQVTMTGAASIAIFAFLLNQFNQKKYSNVQQLFLGCSILLFSICLTAHIIPGFHNLKIIDNVYISSNGLPFSLYLNIDKTFMGILIIGLTHPLIDCTHQFITTFKKTLPLAVFTIMLTMIMALALGFVHPDLKFPNEFFIWATTNLLCVCLAEEALFRGFIQRNLTLIFDNVKYSYALPILISATLFGLAHYAGGWKYILIATVAGTGYGIIYDKTKKIEASILTHFALNTIHFLCFTYPALSIAIK